MDRQGATLVSKSKKSPAKPINPKLAALIAAVRSGDTKAVATLIGANPEVVKAQDLAGATPLHHAAGLETSPH